MPHSGRENVAACQRSPRCGDGSFEIAKRFTGQLEEGERECFLQASNDRAGMEISSRTFTASVGDAREDRVYSRLKRGELRPPEFRLDVTECP